MNLKITGFINMQIIFSGIRENQRGKDESKYSDCRKSRAGAE